MERQCEFLTNNERLVIDYLMEHPRQYKEIITHLEKNGVKKRTANNLLKGMEGKEIFRVEIDGNVFYKLNTLPYKVRRFFSFIDYLNQSKDWKESMGLLYEIKNEVLRLYPSVSFERILRRHRENLRFFKPKLKGVIQLLKDYEGDLYDHAP